SLLANGGRPGESRAHKLVPRSARAPTPGHVTSSVEPPGAVPHARWCGRGSPGRPGAPIPITTRMLGGCTFSPPWGATWPVRTADRPNERASEASARPDAKRPPLAKCEIACGGGYDSSAQMPALVLIVADILGIGSR